MAALRSAYAVPELVEAAEMELRQESDPRSLARSRCLEAAQLCLEMPMPERHGLILKLVVAAQVCRAVSDKQRLVLEEICTAVGVEPIFVDQALLMFN